MPINSGVQFETSSQKNKISGVGISYETTDTHITIGYGAPEIKLSNPTNNTYLDLSNVGLNVQGTSSNSRLTNNSLDISNNGLFSIDNSCNVGIGTTNPSAHLEVLGDISFNGSLTKNGVEVGTINDGDLTIAKTNGLQVALNAKQATITDGDLTIARTTGLQDALDAKQATIGDGDLTIARTSGLQAAIDAKQSTITDGDLTIARTNGLQAALDGKQATVTFNAPSSNNGNPSTSAQIQTALDTKQATINDGDLTIARTSGLQAALDAKQATVTFNAPSSNNGNPSTSAQIQTALDAKEDALTFNAPSSNNGNPSTSAQIKAALDTKQATLTFNAPSSNNGNPSTSAQIKTALDTKQATIGDGDLSIARTSGLQAALDAKAPLSNAQLTGVPTAPTAVKTTNTTQVATTEFVQTKITDLVNTAPGALDTLGEIATALNNDNDFAATMTTQLAGKQATLTFNAPSSNNGNPSTSAQIKAALDGKQATIGDGDLSIARTSGLQAAIDGKQATIADGDLTIAKTSGLQTAIDGKQATIGDDDLTIARTSGLQAALDTKQATLTFNAPSSDNGNPSTSAQIKAALDTKQATIGDGDLTIARTTGLQAALDAKQASITFNAPSSNNGNPSTSAQIKSALDTKQATIGDDDLTIARTSGLQAALDAKQATITDGDLTIARTSGLQAALDAKAPLSNAQLTGVPTAPTAASSVNTTQVATTAFVQTKITDLIGAAPAALDTLKEIGDALGNDADFASTMTTQLSGKQATLTFNAPSSNNGNPSTSAQIKTALDAKQATIGDDDLTIAHTSGLQAALDAKQATLTFNAPSSDNTNPSTSAQIKTALDSKQDTIGDGDLTIARTNGLQAALDAKQATLTFNAPSSNNTNPSTSAQIKTALDSKQDTIGDGDLTIARTNGLQTAIDGKQATIGDGDLTIAKTNGLQAALDGKQATIGDGDLTIAKTSGLQTAIDGKQATLTFNAPSSDNTNPSTSAQIKTALDAKQDTIGDGDLTIARTSGLQAALDAKASLSNAQLTGVPTAPTAASSVNTTQVATTAFVQSKITDLIGAAPAALDTLKEIGDALGNDADFASTMTTQLSGKQATLIFNAPSSNNGNPSTSAQIKTALDAKQATIGDGDLTIARTSGLQSALDAKQASITDGDLTIARTSGLQAALDAKQATIGDGDLTIARTSGLQAAIDAKQPTLTFNAPSSNNTNPSTSAQIKTALDAKQATITDGDLTIARTSGLQTVLDAKVATSGNETISGNKIFSGDSSFNNINFTGTLTQNGTAFVSGSDTAKDLSNNTDTRETQDVGVPHASDEGLTWTTGPSPLDIYQYAYNSSSASFTSHVTTSGAAGGYLAPAQSKQEQEYLLTLPSSTESWIGVYNNDGQYHQAYPIAPETSHWYWGDNTIMNYYLTRPSSITVETNVRTEDNLPTLAYDTDEDKSDGWTYSWLVANGTTASSNGNTINSINRLSFTISYDRTDVTELKLFMHKSMQDNGDKAAKIWVTDLSNNPLYVHKVHPLQSDSNNVTSYITENTGANVTTWHVENWKWSYGYNDYGSAGGASGSASWDGTPASGTRYAPTDSPANTDAKVLTIYFTTPLPSAGVRVHWTTDSTFNNGSGSSGNYLPLSDIRLGSYYNFSGDEPNNSGAIASTIYMYGTRTTWSDTGQTSNKPAIYRRPLYSSTTSQTSGKYLAITADVSNNKFVSISGDSIEKTITIDNIDTMIDICGNNSLVISDSNGINLNSILLLKPDGDISFNGNLMQYDSTKTFYTGGNVGIGITAPDFPLQISDSIYGSSNNVNHQYLSGGSGVHASNSTNNRNVSFKNSITWCTGLLMVSSDGRIKTDISNINDGVALQQINSLESKEYHYIDPLRKCDMKTIGFIAQDVKEVIPNAVSLNKEFVPDELRLITSPQWNNLVLTIPELDMTPENLTGKCKFYVTNDLSGNNDVCKEIECEKDASGNNTNQFKFEEEYANVFLYGKEVDDFHTLDKSQIFSLHHSAIQELSRENTALKAKVASLETDMAAVKAKLGL